jgi:hypothetical protein
MSEQVTYPMERIQPESFSWFICKLCKEACRTPQSRIEHADRCVGVLRPMLDHERRTSYRQSLKEDQ